MTTQETRPAPAIGKEIEWAKLIEVALTLEGSMSNTYSRFYNYSFLNTVLLAMQGVTEPVNTYGRWKDMGRQVQKGSKAKAIVRPLMRKTRNDAGEEEQRLSGFKLVNALFTVSDTEGDELPPVVPRTWDKNKALGALAITEVPFELIDGNTAGYSYLRNVAVSPVAKYPLKTFYHECGHIILGHTTGEAQDKPRHRGLQEFGAEATAYLCMTELDLTEHFDAAESRHYVQTWLAGERPDDAAIRQVFTATDKILRSGWVEPAAEDVA